MKYYLQLLSSVSADSRPCLLLHFDKSRYLFQCPEGTQRLSNQNGYRISRLSHIFCSRTHWNVIGGLPGMLITLKDVGVKSLDLYGPDNLSQFLHATRYFRKQYNAELTVNAKSIVQEPFQDETLKVTGIPTKSLKRKRNRQDDCETVIQFLIQGPDVLGTFLPEKAIELGIPRGPLYGKLQKGNSVTLDDGRVIEPHQVVTQGRAGAKFLIIDCPHESFIDSIVQNADLKVNDAVFIVHMLQSNIIQDKRYQNWITAFPETVTHIISAPELSDNQILYTSSAKIYSKCHNVDHAVFSPLYCQASEYDLKDFNMPQNVVAGQLKMTIQVEPKFDISQEKIIVKRPCIPEAELVTEVQVIPLGTGSAIPGPYRNVSSTLVRFPDQSNLILDCGEGTMGQIRRKYGPHYVQILSNLKMVFISHMHADHHLGFCSLFREWSQCSSGRLLVVGPKTFKLWLDEYGPLEDLDLDRMVFIDNFACLHGLSAPELVPLVNAIGIIHLETVIVEHCRDSYALVLTHEQGGKIAFSGDCRPSKDFSIAGKDASLLIHEATFENEKEEEAKARRHCTIGEALQVAMDMNAKHVLLTHFSQRYPKLAALPTNEIQNEMQIVSAFDLMTVRLSDFERLAKKRHDFENVFDLIETLY